ncbi:hypothetical protein EHQ88_15250 [Leptospira biflexa]|nr:hypothetical protein EHQ88_15250 [Leptospira biflexa]
MMRKILSKNLYSIVFVCFGFIYLFAYPMGTHDSYWVLPTGFSILKEFNLDLNEFEIYGLKESYAVIDVNGKFFNYFPYGLTFLILPLIVILKLFVSEFSLFAYYKHLEMVIASFLVICSIFFLYQTFKFYISKFWSAILLIPIGLGSSYLTTASRALWPHSGSVFLLSLVIYLLVYSIKRKKKFIPLIGFLLVFSYIIRPTNVIPLVFISLFILFYFKNMRIQYLLVVSLSFLIFMLFNIYIFNAYLPPYYQSARLSIEPDLLTTAFLGNLFSPNRGFLIWSPIFVLGILSIFSEKRDKPIFFLFSLIIGIHLIIISTFPHWWGGHSVGPRFLTDMIPFAGFLLCISLKVFKRNPVYRIVFFTLLIFSVTIHMSAAFSEQTQFWNIRGGNVDQFPERIWDWNKPQFFPFE